MNRQVDARWDSLDLAEGFLLAQAVAALHDLGVLQSLGDYATAEQLAARFGLDVGMLQPVLLYVAGRTDLVEQRDAEFRMTGRYDADSRFLLDQYVCAYGPTARDLVNSLRHPEQARSTVDADRHARAFENAYSPGVSVLADCVAQLELNRVIDLGCGPGSLLIELGRRKPEFVGWGMDANPRMCATARARVAAAGLAGRIGIIEGDCTDLENSLPAAIRHRVEAVTGASLLNEFFRCGAADAVSWLRCLRELLPGRALLVSDYYGRLGRREPPWPRRTVLHDFVQVISGQGVPPADREGWAEIYSAAGCTLAHVAEDESATWFIHILRLG